MAATTLLENSRCKDFEYRYSNIGLVIGGSVSTLAGVSGKTSKASQPSPWAETLFFSGPNRGAWLAGDCEGLRDSVDEWRRGENERTAATALA